MNIENEILKYLCAKDKFDKYSSIAKDSFLTKEALDLFYLMEKYYTEFPEEKEILIKDVLAWELLRKPSMKQEKKDVFSAIQVCIDNVDPSSIDPSVIDALLVRDCAQQILYQADRVSSGEDDNLDTIYDLLEAYQTASTKVGKGEVSPFIDTHPYALYEVPTAGSGLEWRLPFFNEAMGPLSKGNLVVFSARPESGKTSMISCEATFMADQIKDEKEIYWFCNEEPGESILRRIVSNYLNKDSKWIMTNRDTVKKELDYVHSKFKVVHGNISMKLIEKILREGNPALIIIDQLRKVSGLNEEREHLRLQKLFEWARALSVQYAPLFAVHQAGVTGDNKLFLEMSDLHGSKTDVQGEADAIIMIGKDLSPGMEDVRGIHIPKNKFSSPLDPSKRHGKEVVNFDTETGRFYP